MRSLLYVPLVILFFFIANRTYNIARVLISRMDDYENYK